jgi:alcohol dehydrogenase
MRPFDFQFPPRIVGGPGAVHGIGRLIRDLDATRVLLLTDSECAAAGHTSRIATSLEREGLAIVRQFEVTGSLLQSYLRGKALARFETYDVIVGVGHDGVLNASKAAGDAPINNTVSRDVSPSGAKVPGRVPVVAVPSLLGARAKKAQSSPGETDAGAPSAITLGMSGFATIVLDAELSAGAPRGTIAAVTIDATTHAVEAWVSTRRTAMSDLCAREAWRMLAGSFIRVLASPDDTDAMGAVLLGSFLASTAAEHSTLGAAHACARPVSRRYGVPHGTALALLLPEVVRWNSRIVADRYAELAAVRGEARRPETLVARLEDFVAAGGFPERLAVAGVVESDLPELAAEASADAMGEFNPRKFDVAGALEIYAAAY